MTRWQVGLNVSRATFPCARCRLHGLLCKVDGEDPVPLQIYGPRADQSGTDRWQEVIHRLTRIESALSLDPYTSDPAHQTSSLGNDSTAPPLHPDSHDESVKYQVHAVTAAYNALPKLPDSPWVLRDVVERGLLDERLARHLYQFYFSSLEGICLPFTAVDQVGGFDRMRTEHSFLLNAILLTSAYFNMCGTDVGERAYQALAQAVAEQLGSLMLSASKSVECCQPSVIQGLVILCSWKPCLASSPDALEAPSSAAQMAFKTSGNAAGALFHHAVRLAQQLDLRTRVQIILASDVPSHQDLVLVRTWFILCAGMRSYSLEAIAQYLTSGAVDAQMAYQTPFPPMLRAVDTHTALTRFHELRNDPLDVKLAAYLALADTGRDIRQKLARRLQRSFEAGTDLAALHEADAELARSYRAVRMAWAREWLPRVGKDVIFLLVTTFVDFALFVRCVMLWADELRQNQVQQPYVHLSEMQLDLLRYTIESASGALYSLSTEASSSDMMGSTAPAWAFLPPEGRIQATNLAQIDALTPNSEVVSLLLRAPDSITCILLPFYALFLASQAGRSMNCNLECLSKSELEAWNNPQWILAKGKLHRLLELTADTLEKAAPQIAHPATEHARMLRMLVIRSLRKPPPGTSLPAAEFEQGAGLDYSLLFGIDPNNRISELDWSALGILE